MPWSEDEHWDGFTERRHDEKCEAHRTDMREWVSNQITLATMPTKTKTAIIWTILVLMMGGSIGGGIYSKSAADTAHQAIANQKATDTQQTADIKHNQQQIQAVVKAQEKIVETQEDMQGELEDINIKQERIMTILERIEKKVE